MARPPSTCRYLSDLEKTVSGFSSSPALGPLYLEADPEVTSAGFYRHLTRVGNFGPDSRQLESRSSTEWGGSLEFSRGAGDVTKTWAEKCAGRDRRGSEGEYTVNFSRGNEMQISRERNKC